MIFCPTKNWCETLSVQMKEAFIKIDQKSPGLLNIDQTLIQAVLHNLVENGVKETSPLYELCQQGQINLSV